MSVAYYVVVARPSCPLTVGVLATTDPPSILVEEVTVRPVEVLWLDGSTRARRAAEKAGYPAVPDSESRWETYQRAIYRQAGSKGGTAFWRGLTPAQRTARARHAVMARWRKRTL